MKRLFEVGRFDNVLDAYRVVDVLTDAAIEAEVFDESAGAALPHISAIGVRVVVAEQDAQRARAALAEEARLPRTPDAEGAGAGAADEGTPGDGDSEDADERAKTVNVEAWASRTLAIACLGLAIVIFSVGAILRVSNPPAGIEA
jgi:hypothetical protein